VKVIYHGNCIDGFTAAWCCWRKFGDAAEYIPAHYGDAAPDVTGEDVLIVDFSYPRETLIDMHAKAKSLRVLDHHKTAQADLEGLDFCLFDMSRSGAGLAWDEICTGERSGLVAYVEDRDLWRWALPNSKELNAFIGSFEFSFENWHALHVTFVNGREQVVAAVEVGAAILRKETRYVRDMAKQARMVSLAGHVVPVVNAPYINTSELVGHLAEHPQGATHVPFAVGWFQRGDGKYQYSLRSRGDFDVSELAKQFGGGGHRNAAGFTVDRLVHE
jgi:hypothetical protein